MHICGEQVLILLSDGVRLVDLEFTVSVDVNQGVMIVPQVMFYKLARRDAVALDACCVWMVISLASDSVQAAWSTSTSASFHGGKLVSDLECTKQWEKVAQVADRVPKSN